MTPLPTPFDIASIPFMPYVPGFWAWVILLCGAVVSGYFIYRITSPRFSPARSPLALATSELTKLEQSESNTALSKIACFRASQITKRALDCILHAEISGMTSSELERYAREQKLEPLSEIVKILTQYDQTKFQSEHTLSTPTGTLHAICSHLRALDTLKEEDR